MYATDGGANVLIGRGGDRAGVQDDDFGFARRACTRQPAIEQLPLDGRPVRLGRTASEVLHEIRCHIDIIRGMEPGFSGGRAGLWPACERI